VYAGAQRADGQNLLNPLIALPVLFLSVVIHECAHGVAALRAGDSTAYRAGRITLNPLPHIDLYGSILLPLILFMFNSPFYIAWAKPVPVNPACFGNPRRDEIRVAFAGPLSNIVLAIVFTLLGIILFRLPVSVGGDPAGLGGVLVQIVLHGISINLLLAFFNLIPVFPLDGSHILENLLPPELGRAYRGLRQYGFIVLIILIMTPLFNVLLAPAWILSDLLVGIWFSFH
jgi:Zn-dependent protease